jgi:superfamily II DNA or RNA helicase
MDPDSPPLVDASAIIRLVGAAAYDRGRAYARSGAVTKVTWNPESGMFAGTVSGTGASPYSCSIPVDVGANGRATLGPTRCSCPVQSACKHIAATLLQSNAERAREIGALDTDDLGRSARDSRGDHSPAWKAALSAAAVEDVDGHGPFPPGATSTEPTPLALQFELREQTPRTADRWRGPTARRASVRFEEAGATYRLGVRPVTRGRSGKWTRQGITWSTLPHQTYRLGLDPAQLRWFLQFVALHRSTRVTYLGQDADWLYLDEFMSPLLWPLLSQAAALGIELVGSQDAAVRLADRADLRLDLRLDPAATSGPAANSEQDGDIQLVTILDVDGAVHSPETAGPIGDHGLYTYAPGPAITVAPTAGPLTDDQLRLVGRPAEVTIPAQDVAEFMTSYYPRLRRGIEFTSADGSVELPELLPPALVLTATYAPKHSLKLEWHFEYSIGGHELRVPVKADRSDLDRDAAAELAILARVRTQPTVPIGAVSLSGLDAAAFSATVLPIIAAIDGVRIDIVGDQPDYRELTEAPHLTIRTMETDHRDWFDLGVVITVEGRDVPFKPLFTALSQGKTKILLADNAYLALDHPVFEQLRELIEEAGTLAEWETGPRISRYQASLWADFEDLADESHEAVAWRETAAKLVDAVIEPTPLPHTLHATLRPYQRDGYDWLAFLWRHGLGGILADDMGLGKTLQSLALIAHANGGKPFLVVAPTSVVSNWVSEATRFTPGLTVHSITATEKKSGRPVAESARGADIIVTSYALLRLDFDAYQSIEWAGALFDEAQFLKNPASRAHECAIDLRAPFKLALTGTPIENSLTDLWALFAVTAPGLFPSLRRFTEQYVRPVGRGSSAQSRKRAGTVGVSGSGADDSSDARSRMLISRLRKRIRPLMMRRTKELVASDLPARQEQELRIELAPRHRKLYDTVLQRERQKLLGLIEDLDRNRFIVFRSLTLLRMLSLDASLIDEKHADIPSSKLDALEEQLEDVVAEGHRALIFSQFTSFLQRAAARLDALGIEYAYLDGSTTNRAAVIDGFKQGEAPVFLISLKAGGFGLNLTEADYVFLLDPWWNPAAERQAVDRTHRIGQTRNVMVYRLVAAGTIEEKVMALKEQKAALFDAVMDDDAVFSSALTADDIRGLLEE